MSILELPADIKVALLGTTAFIDINTLLSLRKASHDFETLYRYHEHGILLPVLKARLGVPVYRWALCVALLCIELNGKGGQVSVWPEAFRRILKEVAEDLSSTPKRVNLDVFKLALKAMEVLSGYTVRAPTAEDWYGFIQHFATLVPTAYNALVDKGLDWDVAKYLGIDGVESPRMAFDIAQELSIFKHSKHSENARLYI